MSIFTYATPAVIFSVLIFATTAILAITLANLIRRLFSTYSIPATLPWAGTGSRNGPLARARANLSSFFSLKLLLDEGYETVSLRLSW